MKQELNNKYLSQMKKLKHSNDLEMVHVLADDILCNLLKELGYAELVNEFQDLDLCYNA